MLASLNDTGTEPACAEPHTRPHTRANPGPTIASPITETVTTETARIVRTGKTVRRSGSYRPLSDRPYCPFCHWVEMLGDGIPGWCSHDKHRP